VLGQAKVTSLGAQSDQLTSLVKNCLIEQEEEETTEAMIIVIVEKTSNGKPIKHIKSNKKIS